MADTTWSSYVVPSALSFIVGYLLRYVEPSSRLVHWFPANFVFQVPFTAANGTQQNGQVSTHALSIQNVGWRAATQVEIIHQQRPQLFQMFPAIHFTEATNPTGEHVIKIESLAKREFVVVQILSTGTLPRLASIKSADGPSRMVNTAQQFVISTRRRLVLSFLMIVGFVTTAYWLVRIAGRLLPRLGEFLG